MVSPNDSAVDVINLGVGLFSEDGLSTVLIKAGQSSEVFLGDGRSVSAGNESIGVSRVANDANFDVLLGNLVKSLTLSLEDLSVGGEKISTLHTGAAGSGTNENSNVDIFEANHSVSAGDDLVNKRVGTIVQLHHNTLEDLLGSRELNKLKNDLLVRTEHAALSNEVDKESANSAGSASDSNAYWLFVHIGGGLREMAAERLKAANKHVVIRHG